MNDKAKTGQIGELLTELELTKRGWHVLRLDGKKFAENADLIALKGHRKVVIQVKSTSEKQDIIKLSRCDENRRASGRFYNDKNSPIKADWLIAVRFGSDDHSQYASARFFLLPICKANQLCFDQAKSWKEKPSRSGKEHSANHDIKFSCDDPLVSGCEGQWDFGSHSENCSDCEGLRQ